MTTKFKKIGDFTIVKGTYGYYIRYKNCYTDYEAANALHENYIHYFNTLQHCGAYYDCFSTLYFFEKLQPAIDCVNYLIEKYVIILKLQGE